MNNIQLVDLLTQYNKIEGEINEAVLHVVRSGNYINGPEVKSFQKNLEEYLGIKHVIPCANGTDALQIALMGCGLKPGDEVITPSFTYIATAEVIALLNLKPVFIEVDPDTFTIDPAEIDQVVTPDTKAIIPVHLYGQSANMEAVMSASRKHGLKVIEDAAQAIGANYTLSNGNAVKAGTIGDIGCTSFFPSKNLGCFGDGGALFTNDDELAANIRMIANHGQKKKYYHDVIGCNSRLDTIQAAILDIKLKHLNEYISARQNAAKIYNDAFVGVSGIQTPKNAEYSDHTYHQYTLKLESEETRDGLRQHLTDKDIPNNIYYPVPIHRQKGFGKFEVNTNLSSTEDLCKKVLSLPMHTELTEQQLNTITDTVKEYFN